MSHCKLASLMVAAAVSTLACTSQPSTPAPSQAAPNAATGAQAPPKQAKDDSVRAAELAVRVANGKATEEEKKELDRYMKGKQ